MSLVESLEYFAEKEGWQDYVAVAPDGMSAKLAVAIGQTSGDIRMVLTADGDEQSLRFSAVLPFRVSLDCSVPVSQLLNRINHRLGFGHFSFLDAEPMRPVTLSAAMDATGGTITGDQVVSFVDGLWQILNYYSYLIDEVAHQGRDLNEAWYEFVALQFDMKENPEDYDDTTNADEDV